MVFESDLLLICMAWIVALLTLLVCERGSKAEVFVSSLKA